MRIVATINTMYPTIPTIKSVIDSGLEPDEAEGLMDDPVSMLPAEELVDILMEKLGIEVSSSVEEEEE